VPEALQHDVGQIVRDITVEFLHSEPNLATPYNVAVLLERLQNMTANLELADKQRRTLAGPGVTAPCLGSDGEAIDSICLDLIRWRARLDDYWMLATSVPVEDEADRNAILWEVTAPLFLGFHGGKTGTEVELVDDGYAEGFDTRIQHAPDIATPFTLANQLGVYEGWERKRWALLLEDLETEARRRARDVAAAGIGIGTAILIGFGIWAGATVLTRKAA